MRFIDIIGFALFGFFMSSTANAQKTTNKTVQFGSLINVENTQLFAWKSGCKPKQLPKVVMISGPIDSWNSDTAWFALLQPLVAKEQCVWSIDRPGHGYSKDVENASYQKFAVLLNALAKQESLSSVVLVAFASSNLAVNHLFEKPASPNWLTGVVMIDPDVLTDHSVKHYADGATPYREKQQQIEEFILAGKNDERVQQVAEIELKHVKEIIPDSFKNEVDWNYYNAIIEHRKTQQGQLGRTRELANYHTDLYSAQNISLPDELPLVLINTDFENRYIRETEDNARLIQWRDEGDSWMQQLAKGKHRHYIHLTTEEHLLTMSDPQTIIDAINWLQQSAN